MASFLVGEQWVRRARDMGRALEGRSTEREREGRRRRRP
jgi:hypothetical protein